MLNFQIAGSADGYLLEHLLLESIGALRGGGIFAWANSNGIESLLEDDVFDEFLQTSDFRLFVGTDSITDVPAIDRLVEISAKRPKLDVHAFISPTNSLFHPKLAWFEHHDYTSLIVGSGNLTMGGLRSNWEAFVVLKLAGTDQETALARIDQFLALTVEHVLPVDDPRVRQQAEKNTGNERTLRHARSGHSTQPDALAAVEEVLVAEIPKAGTRWSQANFDLDNYEKFFGAKAGTQRRISLHHVDENGSLGNVESRPSVEVASHNYRFELAAAKGRTYPTGGSPIGVFLRLATGEFLYSLLFPGGPGYREVSELLVTHWHGPAREKPRVRLAADVVRAAWPMSPLWDVTLPAL